MISLPSDQSTPVFFFTGNEFTVNPRGFDFPEPKRLSLIIVFIFWLRALDRISELEKSGESRAAVRCCLKTKKQFLFCVIFRYNQGLDKCYQRRLCLMIFTSIMIISFRILHKLN